MIQDIDKEQLTPLMRQYALIKERLTDTLLFFQVGDFYELFWDDAKTAAAFLGITLTKRGTWQGEPIPLCGVPIHAKDHYIAKLLKGGFKVALADQLEEARPGAVVKRGITQVLTPGTLTDSNLMDEKTSSYLLSFFPMEDTWGLVFGELLTARLFGTVLPAQAVKVLDAEIMRFVPDEILIPSNSNIFRSFFTQRGFFTSIIDSSSCNQEVVHTWISHFNQESQNAISSHKSLMMALSDFYHYIATNQENALSQFKSVQLYQPDDFLVLDASTLRNLEIVKNSKGGHENTLISVLDRAVTAMGSRTIRKWITAPLLDKRSIEQRHEALDFLVKHIELMQQLKELLSTVGDFERLVGRIALARASFSDYCSLLRVLCVFPKLSVLGQQCGEVTLLAAINTRIHNFDNLILILTQALNDDISSNYIIKKGFDPKLDQLRSLVENVHQKLLETEAQEQQSTGIGSLKIRYNQVFGYSIEVTKSNFSLVPAHYVRLQTLSGKERYTIPALQQLENDLKHAGSAIEQVEQELFCRIKHEVARYLHALRTTSYALALLDALFGMAHAAYDYGYARPTMHDNRDIVIVDGRHPVIERTLSNTFIPNSVNLNDDQFFHIITGPNMGGKSTFLRQVALICLMAQAGSFVPVKSAHLPILARIFTRIGAGDNLAEGKSTFLVEMEEAALICSQATSCSLVILDEVGRGTSTFDGLALAQSIVEYLACTVRSRCLFATHYHELALLKHTVPGIENYHAVCTKKANGIMFLYKIEQGIADGSFGIDVARLAALPDPVIIRAQEILDNLLANDHSKIFIEKSDHETNKLKLQLVKVSEELKSYSSIATMLDSIDFDELSPKKAFDLMWKLKKKT